MKLSILPPLLLFIASSRIVCAAPAQAPNNAKAQTANSISSGTPASGGQRPKAKLGTAAGKAAMRGMGEAKTSAVKAWAKADAQGAANLAGTPTSAARGQGSKKKAKKEELAAALKAAEEAQKALQAVLDAAGDDSDDDEDDGGEEGGSDPIKDQDEDSTEDITDVAEQEDDAVAKLAGENIQEGAPAEEPEGEQEQEDDQEEELGADGDVGEVDAKAEQRMRELLAEAEDEGDVACAGCIGWLGMGGDKDEYKGLTAEKLKELIKLQEQEKKKAEELLKNFEETKKVVDASLKAADDEPKAKDAYEKAEDEALKEQNKAASGGSAKNLEKANNKRLDAWKALATAQNAVEFAGKDLKEATKKADTEEKKARKKGDTQRADIARKKADALTAAKKVLEARDKKAALSAGRSAFDALDNSVKAEAAKVKAADEDLKKMQKSLEKKGERKDKGAEALKLGEATKEAKTQVDAEIAQQKADADELLKKVQEEFDKNMAEVERKFRVACKKRVAGTSGQTAVTERDEMADARDEYKREMKKLQEGKKAAEDAVKAGEKSWEKVQERARQILEQQEGGTGKQDYVSKTQAAPAATLPPPKATPVATTGQPARPPATAAKPAAAPQASSTGQSTQAATASQSPTAAGATTGTPAPHPTGAARPAAASQPAKPVTYESLKTEADKEWKKAEELQAKLAAAKDATERTKLTQQAQEARLNAISLTEKAKKAKKEAEQNR